MQNSATPPEQKAALQRQFPCFPTSKECHLKPAGFVLLPEIAKNVKKCVES